MKIRKYSSVFLLSFVAITLFSCTGKTVFSEKFNFPKKTWKANRVLSFEAEILNTNVPYDVVADIVATEDFRTSNLWLLLSTKAPSGAILRDTVQFFLTDGSGKWLGDKSGTEIEYKFLYKKKIKFAEEGVYQFQIQHAMRKRDSPVLVSAGISIKKSEI